MDVSKDENIDMNFLNLQYFKQTNPSCYCFFKNDGVWLVPLSGHAYVTAYKSILNPS